jgi:hypothetical protein
MAATFVHISCSGSCDHGSLGSCDRIGFLGWCCLGSRVLLVHGSTSRRLESCAGVWSWGALTPWLCTLTFVFHMRGTHDDFRGNTVVVHHRGHNGGDCAQRSIAHTVLFVLQYVICQPYCMLSPFMNRRSKRTLRYLPMRRFTWLISVFFLKNQNVLLWTTVSSFKRQSWPGKPACVSFLYS